MGGLVIAQTICQVAGKAMRVRTDVMRLMWDENPQIRDSICRDAVALIGQFAHSAACNKLHSLENRTARWLLATADRTGTTSLELTHEFLAAMLGANRTTVSLTLADLESKRMIRRGHSRI